jgi:4-carboxymuconolactone decarboxylase
MTRLPYLDPARAPDAVRDTLRVLPDLNLFRIAGHAQTTLVPWLTLGGTLLSSLSLDPVLRELVILQVATSSGSDYERIQHQAIAAGVGVSAPQATAVVAGQLDSPALGDYAPILRVVDDLVRAHTTDTAGFDLLRRRLNDQEIVEVLLVVGYYLGVALLAAAVDLDPDPPAQMAVVDAAAAAARDEL